MASVTMRSAKAEQPRWRTTLQRVRKYWYCYLMMLGTFALLITFSYYPAASAILHSFTIWDGFRPAQWIGLGNYQELFSSDVIMKHAFPNMALLVMWQVVRAAVFPLLGAALIYRLRNERLAYIYRLVFVLPIVVPATVTILVWRQFFDPNVGLMNEVLRLVGLAPAAWLNNVSSALPSLMVIGFPWIDGVGMLIYLAGLLAIPVEINEAAIMDGASSLRRFFSIELPLVIPQVRLIVILNVIGALQGFGWQLLVTRGGPNSATTVPAWEMYQSAMVGGRFGYASAIGMILFIVIFILTLINNASIRSSVEYQAGG
ncbi:MAG: sugar ABC transporter permease [Chloroflexi bacterium]|nr:sugar ABC transporter permease [Chloroflexota bacterium]